MNSIRVWGIRLGLVSATTFLVSAVSPSAFAYTEEQQQACTPDAMRLCGSFIPDVDRITACMIQKKSQLSPECRRFFRPGPEVGARRATKTKKKRTKPAS
ncbi:MAG: hypothetical protein AB7I42_13645 [Bradyrhizobium sp.]|uniref:hypothetical protein n=1 Tax=Bradyrhizobium sp. TaxID=376 RepID=UPI0035398812